MKTAPGYASLPAYGRGERRIDRNQAAPEVALFVLSNYCLHRAHPDQIALRASNGFSAHDRALPSDARRGIF